ncbi:MAG: exodeoxyribonuclease VII large subunit [Prolixibacteraceae bacterium]|nr:exodeoxyribonuclease VII large subunit [Prolixibacteraceae bacterium]
MTERLSLSELNGAVKKVLASNFTTPVWVVGEISEINIHSNGHCYLTLIEKGDSEDRIVAQARATIWSYTFRMLRPFFETTTGQQLTDGIKVLLQVSVEFHEMYGFSLNVRNIDPTYTLGAQALKRREIIRRLTDDGVITMNKELELPLVPQKIAIISSPSAAGYEDFMEQLANNSNGYKFYTKLFPAVMQGNQAEQSIVNALDRIYPHEDFFDVVVMIRGGGSQVDLSCFDNYNIAYHITQFPLPVLTGIGHEKDDSIADLVAHTRLKTPTAVAEFILDGVAAFEVRMNLMQQETISLIENRMEEEKELLEELTDELSRLVRDQLGNKKKELREHSWRFQQEIKLTLQHSEHRIGKILQRAGFLVDRYFLVHRQKIDKARNILDVKIPGSVQGRMEILDHYIEKCNHLAVKRIDHEKHRIELAGQKAILSDPANILKKGYSITTVRGKLVKEVALLINEEVLKTRFYDGNVLSKIIEIKPGKS